MRNVASPSPINHQKPSKKDRIPINEASGLRAHHQRILKIDPQMILYPIFQATNPKSISIKPAKSDGSLIGDKLEDVVTVVFVLTRRVLASGHEIEETWHSDIDFLLV